MESETLNKALTEAIEMLETYRKENKRLEDLVATYEQLVKKLDEKIEIMKKAQHYPNPMIRFMS